MPYELDLRGISPKSIRPLPGSRGRRPDGESLSFTNYYMEIDGAPYYGVCGEIHFSRLWEERWEDEILKMKAGGVNTVTTYIFWIHHEEAEGAFDFSGRLDLRRFVELCGKHGLYVIVRIGPFDHGECRNGGLPDWLYGKPFEVRSLDEGFLAATRRLYRRIAGELRGLYYKDGGPVIAAQVDNEYMHSAAPWEITAITSKEWMTAGTEGEAYMLRLRDMAREEGIDVPFYTCTGWGGAATPEGMMPLWGGYAFRPWIFYSHKGEHPATEEYIYRDNHNDSVPATYNFEPFYPPESKPYLCCEMGGGMFCSYNYRFRLDYESVDAMANIKLASGCNMLGYYMYHGGTHPKGRRAPFLNEGQVPKLSYDFQAAIGEFGQVRASFRRLRALHLLAASFEKTLCNMKTVLPEGSQDIAPADPATLRYAVRAGEGGSGFLFLNNYQDHAETLAKRDEAVTLHLPGEDLVFDGISLAAGENCVLPFLLDVCGVTLRTALAQPLTTLEAEGEQTAFFFAPEGMAPRYTFPAGTRITPHSDGLVITEGNFVEVRGGLPSFTAANAKGDRAVRFVTLSREQSLRFAVVEYKGRRVATLCDGVILSGSGCLKVEHDAPVAGLAVFPGGILPEMGTRDGFDGVFARYRLEKPPVELSPLLTQAGPARYTVGLPPWDKRAAKDILLQIHYHGDIGNAFIDGDMISDNFANGAAWEIGLGEFAGRLRDHPLTVLITPLKEGAGVNVESAMAGRREELDGVTGAIRSLSVKAIYEWELD